MLVKELSYPLHSLIPVSFSTKIGRHWGISQCVSLLPNTMKPPSDVARLTPTFFLPTTAALQAKVDVSQAPSGTACDRVYVLGIALGTGGSGYG